jgi:hypothetical protein
MFEDDNYSAKLNKMTMAFLAIRLHKRLIFNH